MRLSIRNQLTGTVVSITKGEAMAVVKVKVTGTDIEMTSAITVDSAEELGVEVGKEVTLLVKSTEVSLGVE